MASDSQINANRENAQSSTGPTSPAGKQRSSRNSTRIGIFAADLTHTLESDELDSYVKIIHKHLAGFDPKTTEEKWLAERIARLSFSLDRLRDMELAFLTDPDGEVATRIIRSANPLATLSIYESRLARDRERTCKQLKELQDARQFKEAEARKNAETVAQACALMKEPFDAKLFGFDFSHADLMRKFGYRLIVELSEKVLYENARNPHTIHLLKERFECLKEMVKQGL